MKTHELLQETISHLQKLAEELGKQATEQPQGEFTRETGKPKITDLDFYAINIFGEPLLHEIGYFDYETNCENFYNVFETEAEAETEAAYTLASRRVRAFAKAVNGEWKADWEDEDQVKYGIESVENKILLESNTINNWFIHQISFKSEELAAKALELFRQEWQILANP
jgi:hypothetical protein